MADLGFEAPARLLLLLLVAALAVAYVRRQRRADPYAVRHPQVALLASVAPRSRPWRRHASAALLLAALALMALGFARPAAAVQVPREAATVVVALDVSTSMRATDVAPSRFDAAQDAATAFVRGLPRGFEVALVSFAGTATVEVSATQDHDAVVAAIGRLQLGPGTAIAEAVSASVAAADRAAPEEDDEQPPARIVLLSDGSGTEDRVIAQAVAVADEAEIPVSTIAYGTPAGTVTVDGETLAVPVDVAALQDLAEGTGGRGYTAQTAEELGAVYADIGEAVGTTTERREVTAVVTGAALLVALGAAASSLLWAPRFP